MRRRLISSHIHPPTAVKHWQILEREKLEMSVVRTIFLQCPSIPHFSNSSYSPNPAAVKFTVSCCSVASPAAVVNGSVERKPYERNDVRLGLPSKGRMATDTLDLLKVMCVSVHTPRNTCVVWFMCDFIALGFWLVFFIYISSSIFLFVFVGGEGLSIVSEAG